MLYVKLDEVFFTQYLIALKRTWQCGISWTFWEICCQFKEISQRRANISMNKMTPYIYFLILMVCLIKNDNWWNVELINNNKLTFKYLFMSCTMYIRHILFTNVGVRRLSGLRRVPAVSVEDLTHIYIIHIPLKNILHFPCKNNLK